MFDAQSSPNHVRNAGGNPSSPMPSLKQATSGTLFEGAQELRIDHHGQEYRLRQTRNGKLILTK